MKGALGLIQGISGALTAILVYILGRIAHPKDRLKNIVRWVNTIFLFAPCGRTFLFSVVGVIIFVLCKVVFQPLFDLAYFPS